MKTDTHPEYIECRVTCSCGNNFLTRATVPELHVELCAECHPFYTGKQKLVDTGGRVERFQRRYAESEKAGGAKKKEQEEEAVTGSSRRRKAPVAAKQPRPKFEQRPGRGDDRGDRGDRAEGGRGNRGKRGEAAGAGKAQADKADKAQADKAGNGDKADEASKAEGEATPSE